MGIWLFWLHLSFQVHQFVTRRLEQFLVCVLFILRSSLLNKLILSYIFSFAKMISFFLVLENLFNRKQGIVSLGNSVYFSFLYLAYSKSQTWNPSLFCSWCLCCWAMTALTERHSFSTITLQNFGLLEMVCLNTFILNKM